MPLRRLFARPLGGLRRRYVQMVGGRITAPTDAASRSSSAHQS
jgi:hypothetical protein